jgi:hypothetical protein
VGGIGNGRWSDRPPALSDFGPILPPLPAHLVKANWLSGLTGFPGEVRPEEVVLQTYTLPLSAFQAVNPAFRPDQISAIRFLFAGETAGAVYLDEIGFRPQPHGRTLPNPALNLQISANPGGPLAHDAQPQRMNAHGRRVKAPAVIATAVASRQSVIITRVAPACLTTLLSASWAIR